MSKRALAVVVLVLGLMAPVGAWADDASAARKKVRLKAFSSCANLVDYAHRFAPRTITAPAVPAPMPVLGGGEDGGGGVPPAAAAPQAGGDVERDAAEDFSGTNVQEEGVDEPDQVKTDGRTIFAASFGSVHAVDGRAAQPKLLDTLKLQGSHELQLLLHKNRLLVISSGSVPYAAIDGPVARPATSVPFVPSRPSTILTEVDVSDPSDMKVLRTLELEGWYLSARQNGSTARLVLNTPPRALDFAPAPGTGLPELKAAARTAKLGKWMPRALLTHVPTGRELKRKVVGCRSVRRAPTFSGVDMLTVATIDFNRGLHILDSDAVLTNAETVYGSTKNLYVATQRWMSPDASPQRLAANDTLIHKFSLTDAENTTYEASGEVPGYLLSQWAMSERDGRLRVASTTWPSWELGGERGVQSESFVTVLGQEGARLNKVGQVGGLGKGERIYAVRFIDDIGYVVTFRQTDPLYTVDVSDPARPAVRGELKIEGYSAYLHPVGKDLILGVGQDATPEGRVKGVQLSLFDVSDPASPRRLHQTALGQYSNSAVEFDHRAFLYWAPTKLTMIPVSVYSYDRGGEDFAGAIGFRVDKATGITEVGRVKHDNPQWLPQVDRSLVMGQRLFTLSTLGLKASALDTLADQAWVAFPQP
jgi:uncharacterized secreted protein with C-terminal beta-propeller domain